ncbi:Bsp6I family restriction endonuclease [Metamycoplasma gateae]|uniref:Bsp6I family restriction endonuclease n=1 Tax=Metamycoplasma gateae TaxID=35769 RepID=A0ABZ2AHM3_9BACT|nr:Bsp6I family restriction endonuclease [Metamycoplasma gateae]
MHEAITENLACILNNYKLRSSCGGSEDAITIDNKKVQIKATSNYDDDLTSFGPKSTFDILEFLRSNLEEDEFYCYRIPIENLGIIRVNKYKTFNQKQSLGQRPRFSIIEKIIKNENQKCYAIIDMKTGDVEIF